MTQKSPHPPSNPIPGQPPAAPRPDPQNAPVEPAEVLGRHKNSGQKDHKGAR